MRFSNLIATCTVASLAAAHGMEGVPRIFGRHNIAELKNRNVFNAEKRVAGPDAKPVEKKSTILESRQNTGGQCGAGFGSCAAGYCCSSAGWCGKGKDYCAAPDCQFNYGPGCDANQTPPGTNTSSVSRTRPGSVLYGGAGVYDCVTANTVALTYDDGPYIYTSGMLDVLNSYGAKATFFITGNNIGKGEIDNAFYGWDTVIKKMAADGHQIASHTWSHQDLSTLTSAQRKNQMYKNEMALRNILDYFPTYMRPPYSSCNSACQTDMFNLGYHIAYFDLDTDDYNQATPQKIQNSKDWFLGNMSTGAEDYLVIAHDIHQQTAQNLTEYMLQVIQQKGYKAVTLGECLGDPSANWYRSSSGSVFTSAPASSAATSTSTTTSAAASATAISTTGQCGGSTGLTCQGSVFGNCCSPAGWCGSSSAYCGTGCQPAFGSCGASTATTTTSAAASATAVSTDGSCGGTSQFTCQGSSFGNCCSQYGWCGSTSDYCGTGCQAGFGTCSVSSTSTSTSTSPATSPTKTSTVTSTSTTSTSATATSTLRVSTNGQCGRSAGMTCTGSTFGRCCSSGNRCTNGFLSCRRTFGCQSAYGTCT